MSDPRLIGITGATGFMGDYLSRHLLDTGRYRIRALSRSPADGGVVADGMSWLRGDLTSPRDCEEFADGLGAVIHLAHANTPLSSLRDWASDAFLNVIPTLNLIEALRRQQRPVDLVFASSGGAVYGRRTDRVPFTEADATHPGSPYGIVKLAIEHYLRLASDEGWLRVAVLRIANPYGTLLLPQRRQGLIGVAMNQALHGDPVPVYGEPGNIRDYVHLSDVADAIERALEPRRSFDVYNVGSGRGASTDDVLRMIESTIGRQIVRQNLTGIDNADRLVPWVVLDIAKAVNELDWRPAMALEAGIERLYQQSRDRLARDGGE
jgi:UDP-glucose 4-epimerase